MVFSPRQQVAVLPESWRQTPDQAQANRAGLCDRNPGAKEQAELAKKRSAYYSRKSITSTSYYHKEISK
jgi:hypothetical protein